jgi:DNA polymerase-3 subunit alpha
MTNKDNKIFIDTETSGLPITIGFNNYYNPKKIKYYNNSRVIELGYIVCDKNNNIIKQKSSLIIPNEYDIKNSDIHGITTDEVIKNGKDIQIVLSEFYNDLITCNTIISHNILFDINVLMSECYRNKCYDLFEEIKNVKKECTMYLGKKNMKSFKSPKLEELYEYLFNKKIKIEHRALSDAIICKECYYTMKTNM